MTHPEPRGTKNTVPPQTWDELMDTPTDRLVSLGEALEEFYRQQFVPEETEDDNNP